MVKTTISYNSLGFSKETSFYAINLNILKISHLSAVYFVCTLYGMIDVSGYLDLNISSAVMPCLR